MKIESLGITISVVLVCLLTFMPVNKNNTTLENTNLNTIPKEISYQIENRFDANKIANSIKNNLEKYNIKGKFQTIVKNELKRQEEEKKQEEIRKKEEEKKKKEAEKRKKEEIRKKEAEKKKKEEAERKKKEETVKVFDNMTISELSSKLNKSLNSTLSNKGKTFASYAIKYGVDPYLAVAIALHETGCSWECSTLVKQCNNVGGQKSSPGCGGGSYQYFPSLDAGIEGFIANIYNNYYKYGLNTAEKMNSKYAASTTWATAVNRYIDLIKSK